MHEAAAPYDIGALMVFPKPLLDSCSERISCGSCGKSVKFFCYHCCKPVQELDGKIPTIRLPFKLDIIKHPKEINGKSTALHAKVIAPEDVEIVSYSEGCMSGVDTSRTVLLFPGPDAKNISEMDIDHIDKAVVIDGTWSQAKTMVRDNPGLGCMQKVTIWPRKTRFWRYQNFDDRYLATIEAIYFLYRDSVSGDYDGKYDALMFFYKYFYDLIQSEYAAVPRRHYHSKHQNGYIDYESAIPAANPRLSRPDTSAKVNYDFDDLDLDRIFVDSGQSNSNDD
ncbi:hypothetical protein EV175_000938 [Coemansia sp. RSA 1933]|nr:hypothetical protein EV175_000938 [Coemansia sp. RSA 1933]